MLGQQARGELAPTAKGLTVAKLIDDFLQHAGEELSIGTRRMYQAGFELHVKPFFGGLTPQKLTTEMLRQYREKRSRESVQKYSKTGLFNTGKPVTGSTINRELAGLRAALRYALKINNRLHFHFPHFPFSKEKSLRTGFLRKDKFKEVYDALPYTGVKALGQLRFTPASARAN